MSAGNSIELTNEPAALTVAGFPAIAVALTETSAAGRAVATTTLVVDMGNGSVHVESSLIDIIQPRWCYSLGQARSADGRVSLVPSRQDDGAPVPDRG